MLKNYFIFCAIFLSLVASNLFGSYSWYPLTNTKGSKIQVNVNSNFNGVEVAVTVPGFNFGTREFKKELFSDILFNDEATTSEPGKPKLPTIHRFIDLSGVSSYKLDFDVIDFKEISLEELDLLKPLYPFQPSLPKIRGILEKVELLIDRNLYKTDNFYPEKQVSLDSVKSFRGKKLGILVINPVQYNPATQTLKIITKLDITLKFNRTKALSGISDRNGLFTSFMNKQVLNTKIPSEGFKSDEGVLAPKDGLLIVTTEAFKNSEPFKKLIGWKREKGLKTEVATIEEIAKEFPSEPEQPDPAFTNDNVEVWDDTVNSILPVCGDVSVRKYVQKIFNSWKSPALSYLLIVGDVEFVPAHKGTAMSRQMTDNFYAAIDTESYETDISSPDLAVGRISIKTEAELSTVVNKILTYEKGDFKNTEWLKKICFIATDDSSNYKVAEGSHNFVIEKFTKGLGFTGIFPENPSLGGDRLYAISNKADGIKTMASINEGRVIVNYSGHGGTTYWVGPKVSPEAVKGISHKTARPFVVSNACLTNSYGMVNGDCFGETWLKSENGAITFWGASNSSYWDEDDIEEKEMFDGLFNKGLSSIGLLALNGLMGVNKQYAGQGKTAYYYEIYNITGDPTVSLYSKVPEKMVLESKLLKEEDKNVLKVKVAFKEEPGSLPAKKALVTLFIDGKLQLVNQTDENGETEFSLKKGQKYESAKLTIVKENSVSLQKNVNLN